MDEQNLRQSSRAGMGRKGASTQGGPDQTQGPRGPQKPGKQKKKPSFFLRVILFLVALAMVLAAVAAVAFRDVLNLDSIKRWFNYRALMLSDSGQAEAFVYDGSLEDTFAVLDGDLLVCSQNAISLYSGSGTQYVSQPVSLENPVVDTNGSLAVVYDAGGEDLFVFRGVEEAFHLDLGSGGELLSARLNDAGWLAVTYQGGGHKGSVTVYDGTYTKEIIKINLSTFIVDAAVSPDCRTVAIVTMGQENGSFQSQIRFYPVDQKEPSATVPLGNMVVMDLDYEDGQLWVLGEDRVTTVSEDGSVTGSYSLGRNYLKGCSFGGDGFAVLLLSRYRAGSAGQAVVVGPDGTETASPANVLDLDAAGRYLALLSGERLEVYTSDLTPYSSLEHTQNARHLSLSDSGAALLANAQRAWLYLPS